MNEILEKVLEAVRLTLAVGESDIYQEDGTLWYKLTKYSSYDAADHISELTDILKETANVDNYE
jgi:hypothetical protein